MKKRKREETVQFWVTSDEKKIIQENAERNGIDDMSKYLRLLALANVQISVSVNIPNVLKVSDAQFESGSERKEQKRAFG